MSWSIWCDHSTPKTTIPPHGLTPRDRWIARGATIAFALRPLAAAACPKCYESLAPGVLNTYYLTAIMLTLLPFAIIATVVAVGFHFARRLSEPDPTADNPIVVEPATPSSAPLP